MNKLTVYIVTRSEDYTNLKNSLMYLNFYELDVVIVETRPTNDILFKMIESPIKKIETDLNEQYQNLNISYYGYEYYCKDNWFNFKENNFDYSKVKNLAFKIIESEWILFLDSDEVLHFDIDFLSWFYNAEKSELDLLDGININVVSYLQEQETSKTYFNKQVRLIRNTENRFRNFIHETIENDNLNFQDSPNMIIHKGYNLDLNSWVYKSKRNLGLLAKQLLYNLYDKYFIEKMIVQIRSSLALYNIQINFNNELPTNEVLKAIHLQGIKITFDITQINKDIAELLEFIASDNYSKEILNKLYYKLNYLLLLKLV